MPQRVKSLAGKHVTKVSLGDDFVVTLGLTLDQISEHSERESLLDLSKLKIPHNDQLTVSVHNDKISPIEPKQVIANTP